ncbi:MAG TPA: 50S ribosomal protein L11 methyltransferase [Caulobacteraceae bacterium]|jgi:ribosomal protein L11 methyltransferase|nr:50S ribosomal protein L11 methyltransferase [Caulobacteraceae bacterium]
MAAALEITARGARGVIEAADAALEAEPALEGAAWSRIEEDEARGIWRIDAWPASPGEARAIRRVFGAFPGLRASERTLADADWVAMSLSGLPPVRAGRFFVYGAHDKGRVPAGLVALRIEAGAAFGTGHHGTTVGCLAAFDALLKGRRFARVLDVGTGTGVLAIAAARTGARTVVGTDIDPAAVRVARENAALNRARCRLVSADGLAAREVARHAPYDLVFANILAGPLVALAQDIRGASAPGGLVILSGLLRGQARRVRAAYLARGFALVRRVDVDAWTTLVLRRR